MHARDSFPTCSPQLVVWRFVLIFALKFYALYKKNGGSTMFQSLHIGVCVYQNTTLSAHDAMTMTCMSSDVHHVMSEHFD